MAVDRRRCSAWPPGPPSSCSPPLVLLLPASAPAQKAPAARPSCPRATSGPRPARAATRSRSRSSPSTKMGRLFLHQAREHAGGAGLRELPRSRARPTSRRAAARARAAHDHLRARTTRRRSRSATRSASTATPRATASSGRAAPTRRATWPARAATRSWRTISPAGQLAKATEIETCGTCHLQQSAAAAAALLPHAAARGQDDLHLLPQPARHRHAGAPARSPRSTTLLSGATPRSAGPFLWQHAAGRSRAAPTATTRTAPTTRRC